MGGIGSGRKPEGKNKKLSNAKLPKRISNLKYKKDKKAFYTRKELRPIIKMRQSLKRNKEKQKV